MPRNDDAKRNRARERSQTRMSRTYGSMSRASSNTRSHTLQEPRHLSQSRYDRQAPRQTSQSSRVRERSSSRRARQPEQARRGTESRYRQSERATRSSQSARRASSDRLSSRKAEQRTAQSSRRRSPQGKSSAASLLSQLPSFAVPLGIAVIAVIAVFALVFGLLVPSCSKSGEPTGDSSAASQSSTQQGLVHSIAQKKQEAQTRVETANQVGSLETSNTSMEALVTLLGEEETAKLIAQAKTNPDALWIAAHPDAYSFEGIEVQYKILKLAADEPAAIPYVREFPAKYPMTEASTDQSIAMDTASPSSAVPDTSTPHLYQWDRRWAYTIYSSTTFGLTGCGPTSLAMVYQGLTKSSDRTPHDMAVLAEQGGYMSEYEGTDSSFFINIASELGLNCWQADSDAATIRDELSRGNVIIANLGPGYFTTKGHFFVLAGLTNDGQVIVNDPYSVVRSSQTWDADFIASESIALFVYSKA